MKKQLLLAAILMAGVFMLYKTFIGSKTNCGKVILLDGTSSVGKSAIIAEFKKLHPDYTIVKVDDWYPMDLEKKAKESGWNENETLDYWTYMRRYFTEKNNRYYLDTELRREIFDGMVTRVYMEEAKKEALLGHNVIIDTVLEDSIQYDIFTRTFAEIPTIKILVYCPLDTLLARVEKRNSSGKAEEQRTAFLSFEQFPEMVKPQANAQESIVDTVKSTTMKNVLQRAINQLLETGLDESYIPLIDAFKERFIKHFNLDTQEEVVLVPARHYDRILNSGTESPAELARKI